MQRKKPLFRRAAVHSTSKGFFYEKTPLEFQEHGREVNVPVGRVNRILRERRVVHANDLIHLNHGKLEKGNLVYFDAVGEIFDTHNLGVVKKINSDGTAVVRITHTNLASQDRLLPRALTTYISSEVKIPVRTLQTVAIDVHKDDLTKHKKRK